MKLGALVAIIALAFAVTPAAFAGPPGHGARHGHHGSYGHPANCPCRLCAGHGTVYFDFHSDRGIRFGISTRSRFDDCRPRVTYHRPHFPRAHRGFRHHPVIHRYRTPYRGATWRYRYGHRGRCR